jgi:hypothetical protein
MRALLAPLLTLALDLVVVTVAVVTTALVLDSLLR